MNESMLGRTPQAVDSAGESRVRGLGLARSEELPDARVLGTPKRDFTLRRLLAVADVLAISTALVIALGVLGPDTRSPRDFLAGLVTLPAWILLFKIYGLYERDGKRVSHSTVDDVPWIFHALVVGSLGLWLFYKLAPVDQLALLEGVAFFGGGFVAILVARASARYLAIAAIPAERVLLVGGGPVARLLINKIRQHPEYRLEPVGFVDESSGAPGSDLNREIPYLGHVSQVEEVCTQAAIDRVVVASPSGDEEALTDVIRVTRALNLRISILPQMGYILGPAVEIDDVEGVTVLGLNPAGLSRSSRWLKRTMDLSIASFVLIALSPLVAATAIAVKLSSPGPVLYSQLRIGRGGRSFRIYKFRTMVRDADARVEELRSLSAHPDWLLLDHDPRITPVGRVLRRSSIDELPQLWNVVKGDMSLVGPRPMPPDVDKRISGWGRRRLDLTPGVTGLWQVLGRTSIPFEEMVKLDYLYVTNWSLWQDVRLLIRTLPAVMRKRGAN